MKKQKTLFTILLVALVSCTAIVSCGKDDDTANTETGYPKTVTYKGYEVKNVEVYVGSSEGGKKMVVGASDMNEYLGTYIEDKSDVFEGSTYSFLSSTSVKIDGRTLQYKFEDEKLKIFDDKDNKWETWAFGNLEKISVRYTSVKQYSLVEFNSVNDYITLEDILERKGLSSLSELTNEDDTIAFCNVDFFWKK